MTTEDIAPRKFTALAWLVSLLVGLPVLVTQYLPLFDYPNHVARYASIAKFQQTETFQQFFCLNDRFMPNLGFDFAAVNLAKIMSAATAAQLVIFASLVLASLGLCLSAVEIQKRRTCLALLPPVFLLSFSFSFGFNNYLLGFAFLPWALLCMERYLVGKSKAYALAYPCLVLVAFMSHAFVAATTVIFALALALTAESRSFSKLAVAVSPVALILPILLLSPSSGEFSKIELGTLGRKIKIPFEVFLSGNTVLDVLFVLLTVGLAFYLIRNKEVEMPRRSLLLTGLAGLLYLAIPKGLAIANNLDSRMVPLFVTLFFLTMIPKGQIKPIATGLIVSLLLLRVGSQAILMRESGVVVRRAATEIERLPDNAVVFNLATNPIKVFEFWRWDPPILNLAFAGAWKRPLFISGMYSYPNQQPMTYSELGNSLNYTAYTSEEPSHMNLHDQLNHHLREIRSRMAKMPAGFWEKYTPYVFIGRSTPEEIVLPSELEAVTIQPKFILARVR